MREIRLFQKKILPLREVIALDENASHRLIHVLRSKQNDPITLFNDDGYDYQGTIQQITRKKVEVYLTQKKHVSLESPLAIHLGQVISKGEKMDWVIQKATELGVTDITPILSERSLSKIERLQNKMEHWFKIAYQACEQCGRAIIPTIHLPLPLNKWLAHRPESTLLILDPHADRSIQDLTLSTSIALLIGPEGGFSEAEIASTIPKFTPIRFGPRILRTETAAIAALSVLQAKIGDLT